MHIIYINILQAQNSLQLAGYSRLYFIFYLHGFSATNTIEEPLFMTPTCFHGYEIRYLVWTWSKDMESQHLETCSNCVCTIYPTWCVIQQRHSCSIVKCIWQTQVEIHHFAHLFLGCLSSKFRIHGEIHAVQWENYLYDVDLCSIDTIMLNFSLEHKGSQNL